MARHRARDGRAVRLIWLLAVQLTGPGRQQPVGKDSEHRHDLILHRTAVGLDSGIPARTDRGTVASCAAPAAFGLAGSRARERLDCRSYSRSNKLERRHMPVPPLGSDEKLRSANKNPAYQQLDMLSPTSRLPSF